jgi:hypothetical protein
MKSKIPLSIKTEDDLRKLWAEFRDHVQRTSGPYVNANWKTRLTGAGLFVDFLCGIKSQKRTSSTSYFKYPENPWPEP